MIEDMQRALRVTADGVAGPNTAAALQQQLQRDGYKVETWGRGDSVIVDVRGYHRPAQRTDGVYLPRDRDWMAEAAAKLGMHERRDADELDRWLASDGSWNHAAADIPWCGEFVDTCLRLTGYKTGLANPLGARNWMEYGTHRHPCFGSVMVFWRGRKDGWQGHVGFYAGEDATHYHILGGNQSNAVTVSRIAKNRYLGSRWPVEADAAPRPFTVAPGSTTVNEE